MGKVDIPSKSTLKNRGTGMHKGKLERKQCTELEGAASY